MLLETVQQSIRQDSCWICGEHLKRKEKRVFTVSQMVHSMSVAYQSRNEINSRFNTFTESVTTAPNLYEWWSAYVELEGQDDLLLSRVFAGGPIEPLVLGIACQRSSYICSSLYEAITVPILPSVQSLTPQIDPVSQKLREEYGPEAVSESRRLRWTGNPELLNSITPCTVEHWNYAVKAVGVMQGWLMKNSHDYFTVFRKWQERYFELDLRARTLCYFRDESREVLRGVYFLNEHSAVRVTTSGAETDSSSSTGSSSSSSSSSSSTGSSRQSRRYQLHISGTHKGKESVLLLSSSSVELLNMWFCCLRVCLKGEHYKLLEMRNWAVAMESASDLLTAPDASTTRVPAASKQTAVSASASASANVASSSSQSLSMSSSSVSDHEVCSLSNTANSIVHSIIIGGSMTYAGVGCCSSSSPSIAAAATATATALVDVREADKDKDKDREGGTERMKLETLRRLVEETSAIVDRVLGRISSLEYTGVDLEFISAQLPILLAAKNFFGLLLVTWLSDSKHSPGVSGGKYAGSGAVSSSSSSSSIGSSELLARNIQIVSKVIKLMPQSLLRVHVRDMRPKGVAFDEGYDKDLETLYIFDLAEYH